MVIRLEPFTQSRAKSLHLPTVPSELETVEYQMSGKKGSVLVISLVFVFFTIPKVCWVASDFGLDVSA